MTKPQQIADCLRNSINCHKITLLLDRETHILNHLGLRGEVVELLLRLDWVLLLLLYTLWGDNLRTKIAYAMNLCVKTRECTSILHPDLVNLPRLKEQTRGAYIYWSNKMNKMYFCVYTVVAVPYIVWNSL